MPTAPLPPPKNVPLPPGVKEYLESENLDPERCIGSPVRDVIDHGREYIGIVLAGGIRTFWPEGVHEKGSSVAGWLDDPESWIGVIGLPAIAGIEIAASAINVNIIFSNIKVSPSKGDSPTGEKRFDPPGSRFLICAKWPKRPPTRLSFIPQNLSLGGRRRIDGTAGDNRSGGEVRQERRISQIR
jgi:hypothetical protein